jgi:hypothetical protein
MEKKDNKKQQISTQQHLDVAEIRDGIVILKDGGMRIIMLVSSINFALKSEAEQNAITMRYQGFLNSLTFPIQILMQSRKLDLEKYLQKLEMKLKEETNELIQLQINDYIGYIRKLVTVANIMEKKFFITIPFTPPQIQARGLFDKILNPTKNISPSIAESEFKRYKEEMIQRANVISSELGAIGVKVIALSTQQIIELLYSTYNLEEAQSEKLTDVHNITEQLVQKEKDQKNENNT